MHGREKGTGTFISIHAPPRGATHPRETFPASRLFQFTPLREGRRTRPADGSRFAPISIHAPPRGATYSSSRRFAICTYFNSRPSARGDNHQRRVRHGAGYFNSRPSARGDLMARVFEPDGVFQFTPLREGRLIPKEEWLDVGFISIHAPPRGATKIATGNVLAYQISIHAPPRGATVCASCISTPIYFNSRPSARGDLDERSTDCTPVKFQFTPLREGRLRHLHQFGRIISISIHAPPRGATNLLDLCHAAPSQFQFTPLREGRPAVVAVAVCS